MFTSTPQNYLMIRNLIFHVKICIKVFLSSHTNFISYIEKYIRVILITKIFSFSDVEDILVPLV